MNSEANHLYFNGEHYDARHQSSTDLPFWLAQAKRYPGPLLELGCGTGRLAIPLAREGIPVTGIDFSDSMLSRARQNVQSEDLDTNFIQADIRDFALAAQFDLVILPINTLCHILNIEDVGRMLACIRQHTKPDARFIIDYFNPRLSALLRKPEEEFTFAEYPHPEGRGNITVTATATYDRSTQINTFHLKYNVDGNIVADELRMRIYFPQELDGLLHFNGFSIEAKYGDYDESPFKGDSPRQLVVAKKGSS